jgi:hypothetical protein
MQPEVEIRHTFKGRLSSKKAHTLPVIVTIQEEDGYKSILSVVPEVLRDPVVTGRLMNHFKEKVRPSEAENLMKWLLSIGDVKDNDLQDVLQGRCKSIYKHGEFILLCCES